MRMRRAFDPTSIAANTGFICGGTLVEARERAAAVR
jgi:hypothetical protein